MSRWGIVAALLSLLRFAGAADAASLRGEIVNGTGTSLTEEVPVTLITFSPGRGGGWQADDGRGGFFFDHVPSGEENRLLLQASYLDMTYSYQLVVPDGADTTITVAVFDTTSVWEGIRVDGAEFDLGRSGDRLRIDQVFRLSNQSDPPRTVVRPGVGLIPIALPIDVDEPEELVIAVSTGIVPIKREAIRTDDPKLVLVDYPLRPGFTTVAASIEVAYAGQFAYSAVVPYDLPHLFVVASAGITVSGEGVELTDQEAGAGNSLFHVAEVKAGGELSFVISGGGAEPPPQPQQPTPGQVRQGDHFFQERRWALIGALGALLFIGLFISALLYPGGRG